jgi:hypothetical protein
MIIIIYNIVLSIHKYYIMLRKGSDSKYINRARRECVCGAATRKNIECIAKQNRGGERDDDVCTYGRTMPRTRTRNDPPFKPS